MVVGYWVYPDGYAALRATLPPPERRALVLIDPAYEMAAEYRTLVKTLEAALEKKLHHHRLKLHLRLDLRELESSHELLAGRVGVVGVANQRDDLIEVVERDEVALEDVRALERLAQLGALEDPGEPGPHDEHVDLGVLERVIVALDGLTVGTRLPLLLLLPSLLRLGLLKRLLSPLLLLSLCSVSGEHSPSCP